MDNTGIQRRVELISLRKMLTKSRMRPSKSSASGNLESWVRRLHEAQSREGMGARHSAVDLLRVEGRARGVLLTCSLVFFSFLHLRRNR